MLLLILDALCMLGVSQAFFFPSPEICTVGPDSLECICGKRENITISANLNFDITRIVVVGCGTVTLPLGAVTHLQLDILHFSNLEMLNIRPFALVGVQSIYSLTISDVRDLSIQEHGFVGLVNVTKILIDNVTANSFAAASFGGVSNVHTFSIENSYVNEVEATAFILTNMSSFVVRNSSFGTLRDMAFITHNVADVLFEHCDIYETSNNSFSTSFVSHLSLTGCNIGTLASTAVVTKELRTFNFSQNTVNKLETGAFSRVDASEAIIFTLNTIRSADVHSLIPSAGAHNFVELVHCCNIFTCDCNIAWLWNADEEGVFTYEYLLQNSSCNDKTVDNLSILAPVLDSKGYCVTLEHKKLLPQPKSSDFSGAVLNTAENKYPGFQLISLALSFSTLQLFRFQ